MQEAYSRLPLLASPMMPRPVSIGAGARVPQPYTARGTLINSASTTSHTMCVPSIKHAREIVFESGSKLAHCVWASTSFANVESGSKSGQYNFLSPGACHGPVGPRSYSVTWGGNYGQIAMLVRCVTSSNDVMRSGRKMSMDDALRLVAEGFKGLLPENQQRVWAA